MQITFLMFWCVLFCGQDMFCLVSWPDTRVVPAAARCIRMQAKVAFLKLEEQLWSLFEDKTQQLILF